MCPRTSGASVPIPTDGLASLTFNAATNRITTAGFQYDTAGNQTQTVRVDGSLQRFQYDAANRLVKVFDGNGYALQTTTYGATNARLVVQDGDNYRTYYAAGGIAEYTETPDNPTRPQWSKSYIYLSGQLLSTITPNGTGEVTQYHHPDRLGTRLITNSANTSTQEQVTLPFGTALDSESTGASNRRFTSYDRSAMTGLDYAINRTYDTQQGRFTQVDPIKMGASSLEDPQSMNLYAYCGNDTINLLDPDGLFWGKLFRAIGRISQVVRTVFKWAAVAVAIAVGVLLLVSPATLGAALLWLGAVLGKIGILSFAADGAVTISAGALVIGGSLAAIQTVGAIAEYYDDKASKREMQRREGQRRGKPEGKRIPVKVRVPKLPPGMSSEPPRSTKAEMPVPPQPKIDPSKPELPRNPSRLDRLRFGTALAMRLLEKLLKTATIMADPGALAEIACKENPRGEDCAALLRLLSPERRCAIAPWSCA